MKKELLVKKMQKKQQSPVFEPELHYTNYEHSTEEKVALLEKTVKERFVLYMEMYNFICMPHSAAFHFSMEQNYN